MEAQAISEAARSAEQDYLARLERASCAAGIGRRGRDDLQALIRERFTLARVDASYRSDPMSVVLDTVNELGPPEALAAGVRRAWPDAAAPEVIELSTRERTALIGLSLGWLTAGIGVIIGLIALAGCPRWTRAERLAATIAALTLLPLAAINLTPLIFQEPWPTLSLMLLLAGIGGLPIALIARLRGRYGTAR